MSLPFLRAESEETATQAFAFVAIVLITVGLMVMNISGALASSIGKSALELTIRVSLAVILAGAELLAAVALVRVMLAPNWWRKVAGSIIFCGLAWACIQNGKRAVHLIYPEFAESSALLEAKAGIAGEEAALVATARGKAIDATPEELARVRTEIASIKAEQQLMASQSPEKIKEAQALLISQGKYFGRVDGLRETLTEAAMRSRGEELAQQLTNLNLREEALAAGAVTAAAGVSAGQNAAVLQADLADKARKAKAATIWLEVMLWVFEAARSFGLWALVTTITAKNRRKEDREQEAPSDGLHEVRMTAEEREAYDKFKKRSDAAAFRAKLPIEHREWMRDKKKEIAAGHSGGLSAQEIYEASGFVTWHEFENFVNKVFNGKAAAKILGTAPPVETPDPRASTKTDVEEWVSPDDEPPVAVSDSPQDEPEPEAEDTPEPDTDEPAMSETAPEPEAEPEPLDETPEPHQANGAYGVAVWKSNPPTVIEDEAEDGDRV